MAEHHSGRCLLHGGRLFLVGRATLEPVLRLNPGISSCGTVGADRARAMNRHEPWSALPNYLIERVEM
jgi:hypothetical protein